MADPIKELVKELKRVSSRQSWFAAYYSGQGEHRKANYHNGFSDSAEHALSLIEKHIGVSSG